MHVNHHLDTDHYCINCIYIHISPTLSPPIHYNFNPLARPPTSSLFFPCRQNFPRFLPPFSRHLVPLVLRAWRRPLTPTGISSAPFCTFRPLDRPRFLHLLDAFLVSLSRLRTFTCELFLATCWPFIKPFFPSPNSPSPIFHNGQAILHRLGPMAANDLRKSTPLAVCQLS